MVDFLWKIDPLHPVNYVLLLGNGGREHAWALALEQCGVKIITWAPVMNPGIEDVAEVTIQSDYDMDQDLISEWIGVIDLVIIGPETPLVMGMTDWLQSLGLETFAPTMANARLEGSKSYLRSLLSRYGVKGNVPYSICTSEKDLKGALKKRLDVAIKPDGLTGGKGVKVFGDHFTSFKEAMKYGKELLEKDGKVLLEEKLVGTEFSLQGLAYGERIIFLPLVKDYKRAYDGNKGPNTGSMGSVSYPNHGLPYVNESDLEEAKKIILSVLSALKEENGAYIGAIYGQFMLTKAGPKIIEFNARLGDPEAINTLALLESPLLQIIRELKQKTPEVRFAKKATCVIYLVPQGYPENPKAEEEIILPSDLYDSVRFASVRAEEGKLFTSKSRSIAMVGKGETLEEARKDAYEKIGENFSSLQYRKDIGSI